MTLLWLLFACTGNPEPAEVVEPPAAEVPATDTRYVLASRLNLRDAPGGDKVGRLRINSPVTVVETRDDHAHIRVGNGKEGWVPTSFLTDTPTSIPSALAAAKATDDPKERLSWAQRAAALDFRSRDALQALAAAYREVGEPTTAAKIDSQLEWPDDLLLAGEQWPAEDGTVALEWATVPWEQIDGNNLPQTRMLTPSEMKTLGVVKGAPIWVLPERSAAVQGVIAGMELRMFNECGGEWGWVVLANATLPEGEQALAYTIETPPDSWSLPAKPAPDSTRIAALVEPHLPADLAHTEIDTAWTEAGLFVRAGGEKELGPDDDMPTLAWVDLRVDLASEAVTVLDKTDGYYSYVGYERPRASRDFDGDGHLDLFFRGGCQQSLQDHEGIRRQTTAMTCCGC